MGIHYIDTDEKRNARIIIAGVIAISIIISSLIIYLLNSSSKKSEIIDNIEIGEKDKSEEDDYLEIVSVGIGKSVNEVEPEDNLKTISNIVNESMSNTIDTNEIAKNNDLEENKNTSKNETETSKEEKSKQKEEVKFIAPIKGQVIKEFAPDSLVYSETLEEWTTHSGIDIKADKTSVVTSAADGIVSNIKNDPRYGLTVIIKHESGYETLYANLLTAEFVVEGEDVKQGQTIGTVGNSANFEIADDYHLHFEILKDGEYENPSNYIE